MFEAFVSTTIPIPDGVDVSDFIVEISSVNEGLRIEQETPGYLTLMPPAGFGTSRRNVKIGTQLDLWNEEQNLGVCADSSN